LIVRKKIKISERRHKTSSN